MEWKHLMVNGVSAISVQRMGMCPFLHASLSMDDSYLLASLARLYSFTVRCGKLNWHVRHISSKVAEFEGSLATGMDSLVRTS